MFLPKEEVRRPKVGVAVLILKGDKVLFGKRKGDHGSQTWASPGGHLEFNESFEECAVREVMEETGLEIGNIRYLYTTNDIMEEGTKHYITIFMMADWSGGEPQNLEPHKCEGWHWFDWDNLPDPTFTPHVNLTAAGVSPFPEFLTPSEKEKIELTKQFIEMELGGAEAGHDVDHVMRVHRSAKMIAKAEDCNHFVVELGALLHDIADHKFHDGDTGVGAEKARTWLESIDLDQNTIEAVEHIVRHISFKNGQENLITSIEGKIAQDADRLEALGAIGIARAFVYGGSKNRPLYSDSDKGNTIQHFYDKILLLKDLMNTKTGRQLAEVRHRFVEKYLEQFLNEWNGNESVTIETDDYKTTTIEAYDKYPEIWATKFQKHFDWNIRPKAEQFIAELAGSRVADIGCGTGSAADYFQNRGLEVEALDISPAMIKICLDKSLKARIFDIETDKLGEEVYDGIWSYACLLHLPKKNVPAAIEKIARALKQGGIFSLAMKIGQGEGFETRERFPKTKRWFSYFSEAEIKKMVEPYFEIIEHDRKEVINMHGTNKYLFEQYLLRKL